MSGKVVIVTGANSGIGKAASLELARKGARVVMVCRDRDAGKKAMDEIAAETGNTGVELAVCDLSLMSEVRRLASESAAAHPRLDVLVNNAGSVFQGYRETPDSFERTMALNYFSPFLLTNLLLPLLKAGAPSRVVNVTSVSHFGAKLDLADINGRDHGGRFGLEAYGRSKLALVLFTYELSRKLAGTGVTVNCLHPGAVRTGIWAHSGFFSPLVRFVSLFMRSPAKGAETVVYLASSPEAEGASGKYYFDMKPRRSSRESYDESLSRGLWLLSERLTGLPTGSGAIRDGQRKGHGFT
ncbi:MAG: SDR family oxidoreductase [Nitrososphaerota archaeon]|nr:SDR family oxidoreductase [Nitrososphaerota archaeon]